MRQFIKQLGIFLLALAFVFIALEAPIQFNYSKQISSVADWQCLEGINAEVLIVGNSRVESGFDPILIQKATGLKTFLLTQTGWQAPLLKRKLKNYLEGNMAPDFLIVQADPIHLNTRSDWYSKSNFLKYLFLDRENIEDIMRKYEGYHFYEFIIPFVRYRGVPGRYVRDAFGIPMELDKVQGYKPNKGKNRHEPIPFETITITPESIAILGDFYELSPDSKKIGVYPLVSPELYSKTVGVENLTNFCSTQRIDLINANDLIFEKPDSIFSNHTHANIHGSVLQTQLIINAINALQLP